MPRKRNKCQERSSQSGFAAFMGVNGPGLAWSAELRRWVVLLLLIWALAHYGPTALTGLAHLVGDEHVIDGSESLLLPVARQRAHPVFCRTDYKLPGGPLLASLVLDTAYNDE